MGAMSAVAHVAVVGAGGSLDELWDLAEELNERIHGQTGVLGHPGLHTFSPAERKQKDVPRYCFHPNSDPKIEFRADEQADALIQGCVWLAARLPADDVWRRD